MVTVKSLENNLEWYKKMNLKTSDFSNHNLIYCENIARYIENSLHQEEFDLIMIDDSHDFKDRIETIRVCLKMQSTFLIHDYNFKKYRITISKAVKLVKFKHYLIEFHTHFPHTAIIKIDLRKYHYLKQFQKTVSKFKNLDSSKTEIWKQIIIDLQKNIDTGSL